MPQRNKSTVGAPCWIDLSTSDPDKSRAFYGNLFGWTSEDAGEDYGHYINFSRNGSRVAGCMQNDPQWNTPDGWSVYLLSMDAKETADTAAQRGAQVIVAPMDVRELGTMAVVADVGGAVIGIWTPGLHEGFDVVREPGTPGWFELHTRDYDKTVQFYRDVFKWDAHTMSDTPEFRYTTLGEGDTAQAGIMDAGTSLPDGVPSHWTVYFQVEDTDAALQRVGELGGTTVTPAEDTPHGRLATVSDPTGAIFRLAGGS